MGVDLHHWQPLLVYAAVAALLLMVLQRLPVIGRFIRFAFSAALLTFMIFLVLQMAPYQPELSRITGKLGLDDQEVAGKELRVPMAADGHFWVRVWVDGVERRMLVDSGATISRRTSIPRPGSRRSSSRPPMARPRRGPAGSANSGSAILLRATSASSLRPASATWTCSA